MQTERSSSRTTRQTTIGLLLAATIIVAWIGVHLSGVLLYSWTAWSWISAPMLVALLTWLHVGIFIVAHDCMHGTLAVGWPRLNRTIGWICATLYAGFDYDNLMRAHHLHHRHSGTERDPDFDARPPHGFWAWYASFMIRYASFRQPLFFTLLIGLYSLLGAHPANIAAFAVLPALASSLQLFYFGTYLPHRPDREAFADQHNARSNDFGTMASLLTCFHFGYHHEHHTNAGVPWWRLPELRRSRPAD